MCVRATQKQVLKSEERRESERVSEQASAREISKKLKIVEHIELEMKGADVKAGSGASILR